MAIIGISGKAGVGKDLVGEIIQYLTSDYYLSGKSFAYFQEDNKRRNDYPDYLDWQIKKFADALKDIVCILLGCTREQLEDRNFKEKELGEEWWYWKVYSDIRDDKFELIPYNGENGFYDRKSNYKGHFLFKPTPRMLLQQIGTHLFRNQLHTNCWVNATMADYKLIPDKSITILEWKGKSNFNQKEAFQEMYPCNHIYPNWIITDVRFPNEANAVKERGGINIRVERLFYEILENGELEWADDKDKRFNLMRFSPKVYDKESSKKIFIKSLNSHESETALDDYEFDYVIDNNSDIKSLIEKVRYILEKENILKK